MFERVFVDHGLSGGTLVSEVAGGTKPIPDLSLLYREIDYDTVEKEQWLSQVCGHISPATWSIMRE